MNRNKKINNKKLEQLKQDLSFDKFFGKYLPKIFDKYVVQEEQVREQLEKGAKKLTDYLEIPYFFGFIEADKKNEFDLEFEEAYKNHRAEILKNYTKEEVIVNAILNNAILNNYCCFSNRRAEYDLNQASEDVKHFNITKDEVLKVFKIYNTTEGDIFLTYLPTINKNYMKKENLQNLKKYLETNIANYLKISQDIQNLDDLNNRDYINYFEKDDTLNFPVYIVFHIRNDLNSLIEKLNKQLTEVNEAIYKIDCLELEKELENNNK
jgi:hypothetical protein